MAFRWRADHGLSLNAGLVALWFFRGSEPVLLGNHIFLWFSGGGGGGVRTHLDPCMTNVQQVCMWKCRTKWETDWNYMFTCINFNTLYFQVFNNFQNSGSIGLINHDMNLLHSCLSCRIVSLISLYIFIADIINIVLILVTPLSINFKLQLQRCHWMGYHLKTRSSKKVEKIVWLLHRNARVFY